MNRMRHMVLIAGAIASLAALTVGQVSASTPTTVEIVGQEDLGAPSGEVFYFKQGRVSVHKDDTVVWKNEGPAPHSITIVEKEQVPQTLAQTLGCTFCENFLFAHAPSIGPEGPVPPFVATLDAFKVSAATPNRLDSEGDSLVIAGKGEVFPDTLGGFIGDSVSAVITAPEGTTLSYVCAIHPWMQGEIEVLNRFER
jgi:plastocyanin